MPHTLEDMSDKKKHKDNFDKRGANLRANLKRRKEQMRKQNDKSQQGED